MLLTIAIPTYNRNEILKNNLKFLLPQLTSDCELMILDNCSDVPVEGTLQDLLCQYQAIKVTIHRHRANVGGNANIVRCIEMAEGDYVWILADDDEPVSDAVAIIIQAINSSPNFINFYCPHPHHAPRYNNVYGTGLTEFLHTVDNFGNLIFISNLVVNRNKARKLLNYGYHYAGSCGPHVALMLLLAKENGRWLLSSQQLVEKGEPDGDQQFSILPVVRGLPALAWILDPAHRPSFRKIMHSSTKQWLTPRGAAAQLLMSESPNRPKFNDKIFTEYQFLRRYWHIGMTFSVSNLRWWLWSLPLLSPYLAEKALAHFYRRRGKAIVATDKENKRI